ncbi:DNA polymerase epsilon subunit B-like [Brassica rapa]|uniref:DNA polymerase epsilon subunit B-like n=1 Tax=Brassica campestris TaxID=3711 RepID=UPI00142D51C3|nr:DNA polymerase epsilon subunit B-like [Brassica rapa]
MIGNHPRLKESSRFLFIPGPDDAGPSTVLPRCGLPNSLTEELRDVIPNAIFSSNPCRVLVFLMRLAVSVLLHSSPSSPRLLGCCVVILLIKGLHVTGTRVRRGASVDLIL